MGEKGERGRKRGKGKDLRRKLETERRGGGGGGRHMGCRLEGMRGLSRKKKV